MSYSKQQAQKELNKIVNVLMSECAKLSCLCDEIDEDESFFDELAESNDALGEAINNIVNVAVKIKAACDAPADTDV